MTQIKSVNLLNSSTVILGSQWGDEGKGKLVDILSSNIDIVARCQGGSNAGHTIVANEKTFKFHLLPSGLLHPQTTALIGNGVVIHIPSLFNEIANLEETGVLPKLLSKLKISSRAHIVFNFHQTADGLYETELSGSSIGTTRKGIGPTYSTKAARSGIRMGDLMGDWSLFISRYYNLLNDFYKRFGNFNHDVESELNLLAKHRKALLDVVVDDSVAYLNNSIKAGKRVLVEGANALLLDIDYGTYPFVTSSSCCIGGVITGLGLHPRSLFPIIGVVKAYTTRVGSGPFPTELNSKTDPIGHHLFTLGVEYGTTTGRGRRCGWLDLVILSYSCSINHYDLLNLTKLDVLSGISKLKIAIGYRLTNGLVVKNLIPSDLNEIPSTIDSIIFHELDGWNEDISKITDFDALPENAKLYVCYIEDYLKVPIKWIGVGVSRDAIIIKN